MLRLDSAALLQENKTNVKVSRVDSRQISKSYFLQLSKKTKTPHVTEVLLSAVLKSMGENFWYEIKKHTSEMRSFISYQKFECFSPRLQHSLAPETQWC